MPIIATWFIGQSWSSQFCVCHIPPAHDVTAEFRIINLASAKCIFKKERTHSENTIYYNITICILKEIGWPSFSCFLFSKTEFCLYQSFSDWGRSIISGCADRLCIVNHFNTPAFLSLPISSLCKGIFTSFIWRLLI